MDGYCPSEVVMAAGWTVGGEDIGGHSAGGVDITD